MSDPTPAATTDRQVLITRIFEASRERVFNAWTDPDELAAFAKDKGLTGSPAELSANAKVREEVQRAVD